MFIDGDRQHAQYLHISNTLLCCRNAEVCAPWNQWSIYVIDVGPWNAEQAICLGMSCSTAAKDVDGFNSHYISFIVCC